MGDPVVETARLVLRQPVDGDLALHLRHFNTPAVMHYLGGVKEPHEIEAKIAKAQSCFAREGFGFMYAIEKASGEMVGHIGLKRIDNPLAKNIGDMEVGWLIREDRWQRGYAEEAVRAVCDLAFTSHNAPHLVAQTSPGNAASQKLMHKLGMKRRAELEYADPTYPPEDNPTIIFTLERSDWLA